MTWRTQLTLALAMVCQVATSCSGWSDECDNQFNFHPNMCNLKWSNCTTQNQESGELQQRPGPFKLCTKKGQASGLLPVDGYTLAMEEQTSAQGSTYWTLHGLWPESQYGSGQYDQPYGCQNGEEFDETIFTNFNDLLSQFWPTNQYGSSAELCFILSEWMKHGTCAVIPGRDGTAFRLSQETYLRTAFVIAKWFNADSKSHGQPHVSDMDQLISADCVQCAYLATVGWTDYDVASVPSMKDDCIDQCYAECDKNWTTCTPAKLRSTVQLDPSNAPLGPAAEPVLEDEL